MPQKKTQTKPNTEFEIRAGYPQSWVAGVDEVGRGCIAGPVVAAAVVLPLESSLPDWTSEVRDSKLLTAEKRKTLESKIKSWAAAWAVAECSVQEVDEFNILRASHQAMVRALEFASEKLPAPGLSAGRVLIDGNMLPRDLSFDGLAVIKGDLKCLSIACASILAKVYRDEEMARLEDEYPGYGLSSHKGYPTPFHLEKLKSLGVSKIHRLSFGPVKQRLQGGPPFKINK